MFKVDESPILQSELSVILALQEELKLKGIEKLAVVKPTHDNIQICCPMPHNGKQERKPSCGILTKDKGKDKAGTVHCFACGYTASLEEMVSHCFGFNDKGAYGKAWLLKNFVSMDQESRRELGLQLSRIAVKQEFVTEEELDKYRYVHPYMYTRKLTDAIIEKFDIGYDEKTKCITFPVCDERGRVVFIARRSVKTKFFNYPKDVTKPLYAMNFISPNIKEVVVCESIINALTCWAYGKPAIALIGLGNYQQYKMLKNTHIRKYILALDPDEAGNKARAMFRNNVTNKLITEYVLEEGRDINDLTETEFLNLRETSAQR